MSRGPVGKPTALRLISGNPSKRPLNLNEPVPPPMKDFVAPIELAEDEVARGVWDRLVPSLAAGGLARAPDWPALVRYCLTFSRWLWLGKQIEDAKTKFAGSKGTTYPIHDEKGKLKYVGEFPWAAEWRTLNRELRQDEARLGISAASRSRLTVPHDKPRTEADMRRDFFNHPPNYLVGGGEAPATA